MRFSFPAGAATAFIDSAPEPERSAFVFRYVRSLDPHTEAEFALVTAIAEARWRLTCLWNLEASVVQREIEYRKNLNPACHSTAILAHALSSHVESRQALEVIDFLESRYHRQYVRARARLQRLRRQLAQHPNFSKQTEPNDRKSTDAFPGRRATGPATRWSPASYNRTIQPYKDSCDR